MTRRDWFAALAFAALIALCARVVLPIPGTDVPQTAQTIAVLLAAALGGFRVGTMSVALYLAAGAVGAPVFAGGDAGIRVLFGPSGGYLVGFLLAAGAVGLLADAGRLARPVVLAFVAMLAAHAVILATGAALLSFSIGPAAAWFNGVEPFLAGAVAKSVLAAAIVVAAGSLRPRRPA